MDFLLLGLYVLTVVAMIATPGPVMLLVASVGLNHGFKAAFTTIIGTNFASLLLIGLSILMLKGVFAINIYVFDIIQAVGSLYIAYIGYQLLQDSRKIRYPQQSVLHTRQGGFRQGFLVAIANPKDIIFFSAFFPQFILIHSQLNVSLIILISLWIILDFMVLSLVYQLFNILAKSHIYTTILFSCALLLLGVASYGIYTALMHLKVLIEPFLL